MRYLVGYEQAELDDKDLQDIPHFKPEEVQDYEPMFIEEEEEGKEEEEVPAPVMPPDQPD